MVEVRDEQLIPVRGLGNAIIAAMDALYEQFRQQPPIAQRATQDDLDRFRRWAMNASGGGPKIEVQPELMLMMVDEIVIARRAYTHERAYAFIAEGDAWDGMHLVGPFDTGEDALEYVNQGWVGAKAWQLVYAQAPATEEGSPRGMEEG